MLEPPQLPHPAARPVAARRPSPVRRPHPGRLPVPTPAPTFAAGPARPRGARVSRASLWTLGLTATLVAGLLSGLPTAVAGASTAATGDRILASASFAHTVKRGLGTAERGGRWTTATRRPATASVSRGSAVFARVPGGSSTSAWLASARAADVDILSTVTIPVASSRARGVYLAVVARRQADGRSYRARLGFTATGNPTVAITRVGHGQVETALRTVVLRGGTKAGRQISIELRVTGTNPTVLSARVWSTGSRTPAWQATATDRSSARVATVGSVGFWGYRARTSRTNGWTVPGLRAIALAPARAPAGTVRPPAPPKPSDPTITVPAPSDPPSTSPAPSDPPSTTPAPSDPPSTTPAPSDPPSTTPAPSDPPSTTPAPSDPPSTTPAPSDPPSTTPAPSDPPSTTPPSTPTPAPSTTSAPPPVITPGPGSTQPGATNTGVLTPTRLTQRYGNWTINTPGTYSGYDVHGFVYITAPNVTITNSIIRGGTATGATGLLTILTDKATNFVISDSELVPEHPSVYIDGITGWNYTAIRVDIHGVVDGAKMFGNNAAIRDSWIHDLAYYASDPAQRGGPSHGDAIQILGGRNLQIDHNTLVGGNNSALQVTQTKMAVTALVFTDNWTGGGACTVNLQDAPMTSMSGITVEGNRFAKTSQYNCGILAYEGVTYAGDNNSWDPDGGQITQLRRA